MNSTTLSKTYNMAGWRVGFALGNSEIISLINLIQDHYYCSLFGGIQAAAAAALTGPQQCVADLTAAYEKRRNSLFGAMSKIGWEATILADPSSAGCLCPRATPPPPLPILSLNKLMLLLHRELVLAIMARVM